MNISDLILPSLFADALSLGPHWIYNPGKIARLYPDGIRAYDDPKSEYHSTKKAGDFTHYGDQTFALLRSVAMHGKGWSIGDWKNDWRRWAEASGGYMDGASRRSLESLQAGVDTPSDSNDLAGASRIAPLFAIFDGDELIRAAREQTALTHGDPQVVDAAEFFVRASEAVMAGASFSDAFDAAILADYGSLPAHKWLDLAVSASVGDLQEQANKLGLTCHVPEAFPLTLALALRFEDDALEALSANAMVGGDSAARGLLLGLLLGAKHGVGAFPAVWLDTLNAGGEVQALLTLLGVGSEPRTEKAVFPNPLGEKLDAVIDFPTGPTRGFALFAHCFTCGKSLTVARRIASSLAEQGIATLRFDFTGLGASGGDFSETSFLTNLGDLVAAADFLREHHQAPSLLIGHSLGGAAVLAAAGRIPEVRGVVTIAAPADPAHVTHLLGADLDTIRKDGKAEVTLAGRRFTIGSKFLDDLTEHCQPCAIAELKRDLLIFHSPLDETVSIDNAAIIYQAAKHPKSFHSLAKADHLLTNPADADYVAGIIGAWARRLMIGN